MNGNQSEANQSAVSYKTRECFCCGKEVSQTCCARCASGHARIGFVEFIWNGWLYKRVEVGWCPKCDHVWLIDGEDRRPICPDCRARIARVNQAGQESDSADIREISPAAAA